MRYAVVETTTAMEVVTHSMPDSPNLRVVTLAVLFRAPLVMAWALPRATQRHREPVCRCAGGG